LPLLDNRINAPEKHGGKKGDVTMTRTTGAPARARVRKSGRKDPAVTGPAVEPANTMPVSASAEPEPAVAPPVIGGVISAICSPDCLADYQACPRLAYYRYICGLHPAGDNSCNRVLAVVRALAVDRAVNGSMSPATDVEVAMVSAVGGLTLTAEEVARVKKQVGVFVRAYTPMSPRGTVTAGRGWISICGPYAAEADIVETEDSAAGRRVRVVIVTANGRTDPRDVPGALLTGVVVARQHAATSVSVAVVNTKAAVKDAFGVVEMSAADIEAALAAAEPAQKAFAAAVEKARDGWGETAFSPMPGAACAKCGYAAQCVGLPVNAEPASTTEELVAKLGEVLRYERAIALVKSAQKAAVAESGPVEVRGEWWYVSRSTSYSADAQAVAEALQQADRDPFEHLTVSSSELKKLLDEKGALGSAVAALTRVRTTETFRHSGRPPGANDGAEGGEE